MRHRKEETALRNQLPSQAPAEEQKRVEERLLRNYLLGLAPAEERKRVEERLLTDSDYCNELERAEECLTHEYVRGEIKGIEKEQFDSHFLKSAEHRKSLEFAGLLDRYFSEQDVARRKWHRAMEMALASAAIVLMAASAILFRQVSYLHAEAARLEQQRAAADQRAQSLAGQLAEQGHLISTLSQELAEQKKLLVTASWDHVARSWGAPDIALFSLSPGLDRTGAEVRRVTIPAHAQILLLELKLEGIRYRHYRAQVETVEGEVIRTADDLTARPVADNSRKAIVLLLPVTLITRSEYLIKLAGITQSGASESVGTYYLNIMQPEVRHYETTRDDTKQSAHALY
jgi:hypothetical protein